MVFVEVRNGNLEKALRVLKKKVQKSGLVKESYEQENIIRNPLRLKGKRKKKA